MDCTSLDGSGGTGSASWSIRDQGCPSWRRGHGGNGVARGGLCSVEGRALECLGKARLTVTLGARVIEWSFIVAEIGDDEGILRNDFAMAHELTVRPCEGAVYLPDLAGTGKGHMGERLPCTIRAVTEVRAVTEETLAVRAVGSATLAPHTVSQVRVIVPTPRAPGTVMIDPGPGPLGLCPVRGIVEVEQDSNIWLANTGSQPIQIDKDEVVAMAECVLAEPGVNAGNDRGDGDEVNGLVERASPHLTSEECRAMTARKHLFAKGKVDLGRTDIVQHQIHTGRVLHRQFHELEGQGWRPQLVVPADRRGSLLQRFHGGMIGAHLGTARTLACRALEKGVGKDVDREWELRSGGTRATWRTCRNPGAPTRSADPAGGNGSHHALLRPPTA